MRTSASFLAPSLQAKPSQVRQRMQDRQYAEAVAAMEREEVERHKLDRKIARENGNFDHADELREQIVEKGFSVEDRPEGTRIKRIP